jgi:hypothetical protein
VVFAPGGDEGPAVGGAGDPHQPRRPAIEGGDQLAGAQRGTRRVSLLCRKPVLYNDPRTPIRRSAHGCGRPVRLAARLADFAVPG